MKTPKKIYTTILIILLASCSSLFGFGYNVNFELDAGLSNCLLGKQIQENKFVWDDFGNIPDYITAGGAITADLVLTQEFSVVGGIRFKNVQLNYLTSDGVEFGNGVIHLQYPVLQIPLMAKYSFAIHKTTAEKWNGLEGGANQMNTVFSLNTMIKCGIKTNVKRNVSIRSK